MRLASCNSSSLLLVSILVLHLALISIGGVSAGFDFFKKIGEKKNAKELDKKGAATHEGNEKVNERVDRPDEEEEAAAAEEALAGGSRSGVQRSNSLLESLNAVKNQQMSRRPRRPDLDKIREAAQEHQRIESSELPKLPKRPSYSAAATDETNNVQGHGRRWRARRHQEEADEEIDAPAEKHPHGPRHQSRRQHQQNEAHHEQADSEDDEDDDDDDDDDDDGDGEPQGSDKSRGPKLVDRFENKKIRELAAIKFVSTRPQKGNKLEPRTPNLGFLRTSLVTKKDTTSGNQLINGNIKKSKLITGSYWQKQLGKAYKVTKKGIKGSANFISELPKHVERSVDSINAFLQLDSKGKILALIEEANGDAYFVRKEFSQFTLTWSPVMEKALDYLGAEHLDKLKWNDKDELDHRRDALHSLAFGYEFMRLMIVWRENLLIAHEAFKMWLESVKSEVEQKKLELDENLVIQLRTTHTYMLLVTWMTIEEAGREARTKLDYLMEIEDDRPKNYESEYFRNIVVLQEMYEPTTQEFDKERSQVENSISDSGVLVENLQDVDDFFQSFRNSLAAGEITNIDWDVPKELTDFMAKLEPQLRRSPLVYTKAFLSELGLRK